MTTPAEIAVERRGGTLVAHLGGEIDMTNAGYVRDELLASVPNDALALVIDLGDCRSSTCRGACAGGVRTCASLRRPARPCGGCSN